MLKVVLNDLESSLLIVKLRQEIACAQPGSITF